MRQGVSTAAGGRRTALLLGGVAILLVIVVAVLLSVGRNPLVPRNPQGTPVSGKPSAMQYGGFKTEELRAAAREALEEMGYICEGEETLHTEPKRVSTSSKFKGMMTKIYYGTLRISFKKDVVTFRATFDMESNFFMPEKGNEMPELEAKIREEFFAALTRNLGEESSDG